MQHIKTVFPGNFDRKHENCGECQTSCQSACKTSCTIANQNCEQPDPLRLDKKTERINRPTRKSA